MSFSPAVTAILPCNNLDASEGFYARLGFACRQGDHNYRVLIDRLGRMVHLTKAAEGWLVPGKNPFALYLYTEEVDLLAAACGEFIEKPPEEKPWGMYEFTVADPDNTLVRVGWPSSLRTK